VICARGRPPAVFGPNGVRARRLNRKVPPVSTGGLPAENGLTARRLNRKVPPASTGGLPHQPLIKCVTPVLNLIHAESRNYRNRVRVADSLQERHKLPLAHRPAELNRHRSQG